jgi:hypothetical protein
VFWLKGKTTWVFSIERTGMSKAVAVSDTVHEKLERAAQIRGLSVEHFLDELSRSLVPTDQTTIRAALSRGGLPALPTDTFANLIDPAADYNALRQLLAYKSFTLSDTTLTERG